MKRSIMLLFFAFILLFASCMKKQNDREQKTVPTVTPTGVISQHPETFSDESEVNSGSETASVFPRPALEQPVKQDVTEQTALTPSAAENAGHEEKPLIDYAGINALAESLQKQGLDDNSMIMGVADHLWKHFKHNDMLLNLVLADINADNLNEIVMVYRNEENPETENLLSAVRWHDGRFEAYGVPKGFDFSISVIDAVDLITDGKPEIFIADNGYEYPEFKLLSFQETGWEEYDLHALGVDGIEQFIDVSWETLRMGHRVTDGVYTWEQYQWNGEQFVNIDSYTYDNRIEYYDDLGSGDPIIDTSDEE